VVAALVCSTLVNDTLSSLPLVAAAVAVAQAAVARPEALIREIDDV